MNNEQMSVSSVRGTAVGCPSTHCRRPHLGVDAALGRRDGDGELTVVVGADAGDDALHVRCNARHMKHQIDRYIDRDRQTD